MNTASLMSLSPQAGAAVKSQTPRMVVKTDASPAGTGKENFGDVLGKAGEEVKKAMAKSSAEAQGSAVEAREDKVNDDVPEGKKALSQDAGKRGEGTPKDGKSQTVKDGEEVTDVQETGAPDPLEARMAPAAVMAFTMEGNAQLSMEAEVSQGSQNLQSLLPQSSEEAQKNKNFLAMLSGQQVKTQNVVKDADHPATSDKTLVQNVAQKPVNQQGSSLSMDLLKNMGMQPQAAETAARPATMLEVQLGNHQLANQLVDARLQQMPVAETVLANVNTTVVREPVETLVNVMPEQMTEVSDNGRDTVLNAKGMALFQQSEVTMPSRAVGEVMNRTQLSQDSSVEVLNQDNVAASRDAENVIARDKLFAGVDFAVEEVALERTQLRPQVIAGQNGQSGAVEAERVTVGAETPQLRPQVAVGQTEETSLTSKAATEEPQLSAIRTDTRNVNIELQRGMPGQEKVISIETDAQVLRSSSQPQNLAAAVEAAEPIVVAEQGVAIRPAGREQDTAKNVLQAQPATTDDLSPEMTVAPQQAEARQMDSRQDGGYRQQPAYSSAIVENVVDEEGQSVQQLAEEAVGDKVSAAKAQDASTGSISAFQQDLADSIKGTGRQPDVPAGRDVQDDFQVARQIVEQARLIRRGENTQMVIKLHPDHLGELTLKVSVSANGAVNASFHSDNAQVRTIIENSLVQLKQELNNQGLKVDNVDVYAGLDDGGLPQGEGQQAWQQNQSHNSNRAGNFMGNPEDYGEETEVAAAMQQTETAAADGVDYRI